MTYNIMIVTSLMYTCVYTYLSVICSHNQCYTTNLNASLNTTEKGNGAGSMATTSYDHLCTHFILIQLPGLYIDFIELGTYQFIDLRGGLSCQSSKSSKSSNLTCTSGSHPYPIAYPLSLMTQVYLNGFHNVYLVKGKPNISRVHWLEDTCPSFVGP